MISLSLTSLDNLGIPQAIKVDVKTTSIWHEVDIEACSLISSVLSSISPLFAPSN